MIATIKTTFEQFSLLQKFLIKAIILFCIWQVTYRFWIEPDGTLDQKLIEAVAQLSSFLLNLFFESSVVNKDTVTLNGMQAVFIGKGCNGLGIEMLFIGFILSAPGALRTKIIYGLFGFALIYLSNVIRVMLLAYNFIQSPETFDFNHKYTYAYAVYGIIFCLWMIWVEKYSGLKSKNE
ncbi:exosortase X [Flammeovirga sp. OC4]|uniref:exosortase X n=1 Tax=Flammeovirga sp. OC4 TaxID=1382345 RepID=UPI0005C7166F